MNIREYKRKCKQAGCNEEFVVSAASLDQDRTIGYSEPEYCPKHRQLHAKSYSRIAVHHIDVQETEAGFELIQRAEAAKAKGIKLDLGPGGIGQFERDLRPFVNSESNDRFEGFLPPIAEKADELLEKLEHHQVIVLVGPTGSGKSTYIPYRLLRSKWSQRGPVVVTQPRIQPTKKTPKFIARVNNTSCGPGAEIGFSHSTEAEYDRRTKLLFMTDGKLINDIVTGAVANYSIIIIDEAHERSVNIDLILGLLQEQLYLYPHLRVIIASATIDQDTFISFFGGKDKVPFIEGKGRSFPINPHWWGDEEGLLELYRRSIPGEMAKTLWSAGEEPWWEFVNGGILPDREVLPEAIADLVQYMCKKLDELPESIRFGAGGEIYGNEGKDGHILVFLPGSREIDKTVSSIRARNLEGVLALPLYATLPDGEQDRAIQPSDPKEQQMRRVVVSTNLAETSLTVKGIKYVIDSGYIKESYWNSKSEISELRTVRHSKAGCKQRWGRAGRVAPGDAYMLYTQQQFDEMFPDHTSPDLARSSLEQVSLTALAAGVRDIFQFKWMPLHGEDKKRFDEELHRAIQSLREKKAIDEVHDLTRFGLELRGVPAELDVAAIFAEGDRHAMGVEVATLLPFLKLASGLQSILRWEREWDTYQKLAIRQHHQALSFGCKDDLDVYLKLWMIWESLSTQKKRQNWCNEAGIEYKTFKESIEEERKKLIGTVMDWRKAEKRPILVEKIDALRVLIAYSLRNEIYVPLESQFDDEELTYLDWESYWDGIDHYEEYADDFDIDPNLTKSNSSRTSSGLFRRYSAPLSDSEEATTIEIAPISICHNQDDLDVIVVCQRRANFLRPAHAKTLGLNLIRLSREWLNILEAAPSQRPFIYASLSRWRDPAEHIQYRTRLFLPWLVPINSEVILDINNSTISQDGYVDVKIAPQNTDFLRGKGELKLRGLLVDDQSRSAIMTIAENEKKITANVIGYDIHNSGEPILLLAHRKSQSKLFKDFYKRYRNKLIKNPEERVNKDVSIEVEMVRILEDPLGRRPLFIVRELQTGLEIPMSASDFCNDTRFRPYFGLRFQIEPKFKVDIDDILLDQEEVYLSRIRYLLDEYEQVPANFDRRIVDVEVKGVDKSGVYLAIKGMEAPYISFVRRALWPHDFNPQPGNQVAARLRRYERNANIKKLRERLHDGDDLPQELDLGIELDLRIPPAYERFKNRYPEGSILTVNIDRQLDSGGLLVDVDDSLKGLVYSSELGLKEDGNLKKARDYTPGDRIDVRVVRLFDDTASVQCSIFRKDPIPDDINKGDVFDARIVEVRTNRKDPQQRFITCSIHDKYRVDARSEFLHQEVFVGDTVKIRINLKFEKTAYLRGTIVDGN